MESKIIYPDDLSDEEWDLIKHLVPKGKSGGRSPTDRNRFDAIKKIKGLKRHILLELLSEPIMNRK